MPRVIEPGTPKAAEMEEFRGQKKIILELLNNFPITLARHPQLECDDTIASLCVDVHKDDECVIVSTDTDFMQLLDKSDGDGSCFVDIKKLSLSQLGIILRSDVLNSLSMVSENVDSHHCVVEFRVCALQDFIVLVLFVIHGI